MSNKVIIDKIVDKINNGEIDLGSYISDIPFNKAVSPMIRIMKRQGISCASIAARLQVSVNVVKKVRV